MSVSTLWEQGSMLDFIPKGRPPSPKESKAALVAAPAVASLPETKDSINLRGDVRSRQLTDEAAHILGKTRTEFLVESGRREAVDVLLDQTFFLLDAERHDLFARVLDDPPAPGPKLRSLLRRVPAWEK